MNTPNLEHLRPGDVLMVRRPWTGFSQQRALFVRWSRDGRKLRIRWKRIAPETWRLTATDDGFVKSQTSIDPDEVLWIEDEERA